MGRLAARLQRLQRLAGPASACPDPWHHMALRPRIVDYRESVAALAADGLPSRAPAREPSPPDVCPTCGEARQVIEIHWVDWPPR